MWVALASTTLSPISRTLPCSRVMTFLITDMAFSSWGAALFQVLGQGAQRIERVVAEPGPLFGDVFHPGVAAQRPQQHIAVTDPAERGQRHRGVEVEQGLQQLHAPLGRSE